MIRYTQKVRNILNFIDKYGFITSKICANLFYKDNKYKLDMARRTLNKLVNNKDIISNTSCFGKELIYQFNKNIVSEHRYALLNLYSEINCIVNNIEYFKLEEQWLEGKRKSDAHIIISNIINGDEVFKSYLIEYDKYHKTDIKKYEEIYNSNEVQQWYLNRYEINNYFPIVMIVNYSGKVNQNSDNFNIIALDYDFTDLTHKILLD